MNQSFNRRRASEFVNLALKGTICAVLALPMAVHAQVDGSVQKKNKKQEEIESITVVGQKVSDVLAINAKRNSSNIIEALSTDDLGQLPDNNLGESIGRMSGVSTVLDEGVGRYVTIRGIDPSLVNVGIDGSAFGSTARTFDSGGGRASNMEALSSDFIGSIEVFKSVSADMDGDSIGGSINFISKSAFSMKEGTDSQLYLNGAIGANTSDDAPFSDNGSNDKLTLGYTARFGRENQFGLLLTANQKNEDKDVLKEGINYWVGATTLPSGDLAPTGVWDGLIHETGKKKGGSAKFEYWPNDNFYGFVSIIYSDEDQKWNKGEHITWNSGSYDESTSTFSNFAGLVQHKTPEFGTDGLIYSLGGDWDINDGEHEVSVRAATSSSESYLNEERFKWTGNWAALNGSYAVKGRNYLYDFDAESDALFNDPTTYNVDEIRDKQNTAETTIDTMRIDWSHNLDGEYGSFGFKTGAKHTKKEYEFLESFIRAQKYKGSEQYNSYIDSYDYLSPSASNPLLFGDVNRLTNDLISNFGSIRDFVYAETSPGSGTANFQKIKSDYTNARDLFTDETVDALYFIGTYSNEDTLFVKAGLRYEDTKWNGKNRLNGAQDEDFVNHGGSYDHLLPSLSVTFNYSESLVLRAAFSQTVGRPGMEQYAASESTPNSLTGVYRRSNPNLKPRESDNYDLSLEKYFDEGNSLFSVGVFEKNITNEIYDQQVAYQFDNGIEIVDSFYSQPGNAGSSEVSGFEVSYILTSFDFLPEAFQGLGFRANLTSQTGDLTILDSEGNVERKLDQKPQSPETIYNLSVTYDDHDIDARLSYQFQGERTISVAGGSDVTMADDLVRQDSKRLDLHLGYQVLDNVNIYLDIWNLTEEETRDEGFAFWDETTQYGSSYWLGTKISW
jgi:TonB-dependent receptor